MDKEIQDLAWKSIPRETREEIKKDYNSHPSVYHPYFNEGYEEALKIYFGHHNLTSDTEPTEPLFVEKKKVQELYHHFSIGHDPIDKDNEFNRELIEAKRMLLIHLFQDKCLPDKEPSVQGEPKFKVGDKVRFKVSYYKEELHGKVGIICAMNEESECNVEVDNTIYWARESDLEPYTETETKDNMEEKELNLCELLKGCEGETFYSLIVGDVTFEGIISHNEEQEVLKPIACTGGNYNSDGTYTDPSDNGVCCLFPSLALYIKYPLDPYSAWMKWRSERTPKRWRAEKYEKYWYLDRRFIAKECTSDANSDFDRTNYENGNMFRTKEEAQQAAEAVRECLMKFHEQNSKI